MGDYKCCLAGLAHGPTLSWIFLHWCCEDGSADVLQATTWQLPQFPCSLPAMAPVTVSILHHYHMDFPFLFFLSSFSLGTLWDAQLSQPSSPWTDYLLLRGQRV